ncbi:hypothetical protein BAUCODRAFT_38742 [Baudoinia panamericana UAMH 10762]|uniref:DNA polymerase delta subunit 3 n=1 Tax=Baudoinia panamericana (strain UAMH 10762) TaxID=717646 RepID=M2LCG2_BAUPA|nr:uncharacterized protein BAUCODRAFT_38742 [Baudoinia panamericana UAMH 10762]EMC91637.1 hypothetical protein BAUCODRAFT_38742 [Baudoinia panamericana UAMH 10762]
MSANYSEWLAINVLNEEHLISYRSLSRALKVHSNLAKQMLYDFHRKQNAKRPGSVHATYLISGTKHAQAPQSNGYADHDGEDTAMQSSPPLPSSSMPQEENHEAERIVVRSMLLVKEEQLEQAKATFEAITGIHIYSLQAKGLSDIHSLTECNRKIAVDYASEDPLLGWKQYGTIQNPNVKRRSQKRQPPPPAPAPEVARPRPKPAAVERQASKDSQDSKTAAQPPPVKANPELNKRSLPRQSSEIFKSFAKGKSKDRKAESQSSAEASPALKPQDEPMADFSDEEADEHGEDIVEEVPKVTDGKSKSDREAELQAMMEQEDEIMQDAADAIPDKGASAEDDEDDAIDKPEAKTEDETKESVAVENGRRRGRRRVIKKKTVKDEDGYLVTREEPAWESYSEEEPAPKKVKVTPALPAVNIAKAAGGKKGGKPGQGNIMSFFSKK